MLKLKKCDRYGETSFESVNRGILIGVFVRKDSFLANISGQCVVYLPTDATGNSLVQLSSREKVWFIHRNRCSQEIWSS